MNLLRNNAFELVVSPSGTVESFVMADDPARMNWVIDARYVEEAGYTDQDKRFGQWAASVNGEWIESVNLETYFELTANAATIKFEHPNFFVQYRYALDRDDEWRWTVECANRATAPITINGFHSWFSLAYIMFRDQDVSRNMNQSCALFPHVGGDFAKFAAMRRSNTAPHLAVYSTGDRVAAFGSYCSYVNRFLEQVSPSLDGLLYHRLSFIEDGSSMADTAEHDWIYGEAYEAVTLQPSETRAWTFVFTPYQHQEDFYKKALVYGHPQWTYSPVITTEGQFVAEVELPVSENLQSVCMMTMSGDGNAVDAVDITSEFRSIPDGASNRLRAVIPIRTAGEFKVVATLENGRTDVLVGNVLEPIQRILEKRAAWLCENNVQKDPNSERPFAFLPLSNQGESLGKLTFILMKNSLSPAIPEQVAKAEMSAFLDMKPHWFEQGNLSRPNSLYGSFYRIYDFDYIGHVFYLLSRMDDDLLTYNASDTYLAWAADVLCMRLDPDCHGSRREKEESQLVGVFILYISDLLTDLMDRGLQEQHARLHGLWLRFVEGLKHGSKGYRGAITEHFYDNAGFGPTCEALCLAGLTEEARLYSQLIIANIGFSNDYRANAPDRWWEALSYMTHSLWGGLVAGAARASYETLGDPRLLEAGYRATMAVFNCYDWNVQSTARKLKPGEAASTYSIAAPNLNMPELSRNRFGQSVFKQSDDPLFSSLFASIEGDDWDMGEELVAYMLGFGTTTYLYTDASGHLRCVNGFLEPMEEGWKVTSYAAYPRKFVMLEKELTYTARDGETLKSVCYTNGNFLPVGLPVQ